MLRKNFRLIGFIQAFIDVLLTFLAFLSAYYVRFYSDTLLTFIPASYGIPPLSDYVNIRFIAAIAILWPVIFRINRMYKTKRGLPVFDLVLSVISSVTISTTFLLVLTFFMRSVKGETTVTYSRALILTFWILDIFYILLFRLIIYAISRHLRKKGYNQRHILIAGAGELGQLFLNKIHQNPELGLRVVGFVDDDLEKQWTTIDDVSVLGTIDDVPELIRKHGIEQVYTALPLSAHRRIYHLLSQIQNECIDIKLIPDILQYITLRAGFQNMDGVPIINLTETPLSGSSLIIKRVMDLFLATLFLILFSPLMILIALMVKFTSPGPVLYRQKRMGMDLKSFDIYKFRSMVMNSDGENGTGWTIPNDPRITRVGRILRTVNLDELPQLFNVLKGDMSLVGPRPEQPAFVEEFRARYPRYMIRHKVKSGMTGWAQVNGYRGDTSIKKRLEYDMYYIENWSLALDMKILIRTIFKPHKHLIRPESDLL
ncbi:undecaprenyl-phosphate glucose phosphotransferase [bacterium]|nr:undecaprenyl-phosphate glucose phosphotransferase [candidate division CSSED10-310 bacterium]